MVAYSTVLNQGVYTDRTWIGMTALSIVFHVLFFSGVVFLPELQTMRPHIPSAVEVDLVSLPVPEHRTQPPLQAGTEVPRVEPLELKTKPKAVQTPQESVEFKASPPKKAEHSAPEPLQVKRSLKKKTYDVSKVITGAIARIEKQAPESRPRTVLQAIDELRRKDQGTTGMVTTEGLGAAKGDIKKLELLDIYHAEIWHQIQKNWAFSEEMAQGRPDLEAVIILKVMRDGKMQDIWFEKRSGNNYFDDSALRAVKKSDPLPPLPDGFLGPYHEVGIRFNLSELQGRP